MAVGEGRDCYVGYVGREGGNTNLVAKWGRSSKSIVKFDLSRWLSRVQEADGDEVVPVAVPFCTGAGSVDDVVACPAALDENAYGAADVVEGTAKAVVFQLGVNG